MWKSHKLDFFKLDLTILVMLAILVISFILVILVIVVMLLMFVPLVTLVMFTLRGFLSRHEGIKVFKYFVIYFIYYKLYILKYIGSNKVTSLEETRRMLIKSYFFSFFSGDGHVDMKQ